MKTATVRELKTELSHSSQSELLDLCLRLSRFKKENKELLTYLLFESSNEEGYKEAIKVEVDELFEAINVSSYYFIKKSARKILRLIKKYNRYSLNKETEVELLLYFCIKLNNFYPSIKRNVTLTNLLNRQVAFVKKKVALLHEDLQYDFQIEINKIETN